MRETGLVYIKAKIIKDKLNTFTLIAFFNKDMPKEVAA